MRHWRCFLSPPPARAAAWLMAAGLLALAGIFSSGRAWAAEPAGLRFGILPLSGPLESRKDWQPLLDALGDATGLPVHTLSVNSYEALSAAIQRHEVDVAFLSGKMALSAVTEADMLVIAQVTRGDGLPGYRALLLAQKGGPVTRKTLLTSPGKWRLAHGGHLSMSGYVVPNLQFFLPNGIKPEIYFKSEHVGTHQDNALAVANGETDLATNNSADLERFQSRFPAEFERIEVLWESELIPHAQIVVNRQLAPEVRQRIQQFLLNYARGDDERAQREREVLAQLHGFARFLSADNSSLEGTARLNYELARQSALSAQWVSPEAQQDRLKRLAAQYQEQRRKLRPHGG